MVRWRSVDQANEARNDLSPFLVAARARIDWTSQMLPQWSVIEIPEGTVFEAAALLELDPAIDRIEREPIVTPCNTTPNDDYWPSQQPSLDLMHTRCAWDKITNTSVLVAVLDDGVNYDHPDLYPNIWKNTAEINGSAGKDDDGDGIIDDFYGASFLPHTDFQWVADGDPRGNMALGAANHGTKMASIMGAVGNNGLVLNDSYIAGAFWSGKMIPVQVYSFQTLSGFAAYRGMEYAYYRGARIMNMSFQLTTSSTPSWMEQFMLVPRTFST